MAGNARSDELSLWISETSSMLPLPAGWTEVEDAGVPTARGPEGDVELGFVTLPAGESDTDTAAAAWSRLTHPHELELRHEQEVPAAEGWERAYQFVYRVRGREDDVALATLRLVENTAYVTLLVASKAGLDRRMAQLGQLIQAWRPEALQAEDLSDRKARAWSERDSEAIGAFVREGMEALGIPGMAIAVVQGGRIVECQGFGRCGVDAAEPVIGDTRFMVGSSTKALTTLMMARLIGQGRFEWSTRVLDLMPDFAFADVGMTQRLEMRHTVSASTGMPRSDMELALQADGNDPERCLGRMKKLQPTTGFGETFQYSNQLVALGGFAAAKTVAPECDLAQAYRIAMDEQVFAPLGMDRTTLEFPEDDRALPHSPDMKGETQPIEMQIEAFAKTVAPAGAVWSTARDMARYVQMELAGGLDTKGKRYIGGNLLRQRREPQIQIGRDSSYGLGLILARESGLELITHGGNTFGFTADMWFMPEQDLGVVVLANLARVNDFTAAIRQRIREMLFDAREKSDELLSLAVRGREAAIETLSGQVSTDAEAQACIADLEGTYVSDDLGRVEIKPNGDGFMAQTAAWSSALGVESREDGCRQLAFTTPPWSGGLRLRVEDGGDTLVCTQGQQQYAFRRQSA